MGAQAPVPREKWLHIKLAETLNVLWVYVSATALERQNLRWEGWGADPGVDVPFANGKGKMVWTGQCSATALSQWDATRSTVSSHVADLSDDPTSTLYGMSQPQRETGTLWSVGVLREKWVGRPVIGKEKSKLLCSLSLKRKVFELLCWMPEVASLYPFLRVSDFTAALVS